MNLSTVVPLKVQVHVYMYTCIIMVQMHVQYAMHVHMYIINIIGASLRELHLRVVAPY